MKSRFLRCWFSMILGAGLLVGVVDRACGQIRIVEVFAEGSSTVVDEDGDSSDWIELLNVGATPADLNGWYLTDDISNLVKWRILRPTSIAAGEFLTVFASGKNRSTLPSPLHTNFKLDVAGESLRLVRPDGVTVEASMNFGPQYGRISFGNTVSRDTLLGSGTAVRILAPTAAISDTWRTSLSFNDASWLSGALGVGYPYQRPRAVLPPSATLALDQIAYHVPRGTVGNQADFPGNLGLDFNLTAPLAITKLGVFDSGANGLNRSLVCQLWSRSGNSGSLITSLSFSPANPGELVAGSRFLPLPSVLYLVPGSYTVSAYGYGTSEPNGNSASPVWTTTPAPQIAYVGGPRFGNSATPSAFPATVDAGPLNRYAAGTFEFSEAVTKVAYVVPANTIGTQSTYPGSLGMDFVVTAPIAVTRLGVFDSGANGLQRTLTAQIWSRNVSPPTSLATLSFTPTDSGVLLGGSRFKPLAAPLILSPGAYTISAYGYGAGEPNGNTTTPPPLWTTTADSRVAYVGTGRFASGGATGFPDSSDGGPANRYAAGTFEFLSVLTPAEGYSGLANASFEQPTINDGGWVNSITGWSSAGAGGVGTLNPADAMYPGATDQTPELNSTVPDGRNVAFISGYGRIWQTLSLRLAPYTVYTARVSAGQRLDVGRCRYALRLYAGDEIVSEVTDQTAGVGSWRTTTANFRTGPSHPSFGRPLRIEVENFSETQTSFDRFELTTSPDTGSSVSAFVSSLTNGTFEAQSLADGGYVGQVLGWQFSGAGAGGIYNPADAQFAGANDQVPDPDTPIPNGRNVVYVQPGGTLSQDLMDVLQPGHSYELSFVVGRRLDSAVGGTYRVRLLAGGQSIASVEEAQPGAGVLLRKKLSLPVQYDHTQVGKALRVELTSVGPQQVIFDDVRLTASNDIRLASSGMQNVSASLYLRVPFSVSGAADVQHLALRMRYDDGFVVWLNGTEVARQSAPATPTFNSIATSARTGVESFTPVEFNLNAVRGLLQEGMNLLAIQGLNASAADGDFFMLPELVATRMAPTQRYFTEPSPGAPSRGASFAGVAPPVTISPNSGFQSGTISVAMSTPLAGATIRYTTDGSLPTAASPAYTAPIPMSGNVMVRAVTFANDFYPSVPATRSYFSVASVLSQGPDAQFPNWGNFSADYTMDPTIVNHPVWGQRVAGDLRALPIISIVMDPQDLFGVEGIYYNPALTGDASERKCHMEYIEPPAPPTQPNDAVRFETDCGIRVQGDASRAHSESAKKSFRLAFRSEYGASKFEYGLFRDTPVASFDTLRLKAHFGDGWTVPREHPKDSSFVRDQWARDTQRAMGQPSPHGNSAYLFLNGKFWGLYNVMERPDGDYCASHFGGKESDYDVLSSGELIDGNWVAWNGMFSFAEGGLADPARYQTFITEHIDVDSLIDYMILNLYAYNQDWFGGAKNWYAYRFRGAGGKWKFISWDAEHIFSIIGIGQAVDTDLVEDFNTPGIIMRLYHKLRDNPEFRVRFGDRVHRHCYNTGPLNPANLQARWQGLASAVDPALALESARWGDSRPAYTSPILTGGSWTAPLWQPPLTPNDVAAEQTRLFSAVFPSRRDAAIVQFRRISLYPVLNPPSFNQHGGAVPPSGFTVTIANNANGGIGNIYYTTDGTDPRLTGGALNPAAVLYSTPIPLTGPRVVRARVRDGSGPNADWSPLLEAQFGEPLLLTEIHYNPPGGSTFEFLEFKNVGREIADLSGYQLSGEASYLFPTPTFLAPGAFITLANTEDAFFTQYGMPANGKFSGNLNNGGGTLQLSRFGVPGQIVTSVTYDDVFPWPISADGGGNSLQRMSTAFDLAPTSSANWTGVAPTPGADLPGFAPGNTRDRDGDGLPDIWEARYGTDPDRDDGSEDLDEDGRSNLEEFFAGTDPMDRAVLSSRFLPALNSMELRFDARPQRSYRIESKPNLAEREWGLVRRYSPTEQTETVIYVHPLGPEQFQVFRLVIETP